MYVAQPVRHLELLLKNSQFLHFLHSFSIFPNFLMVLIPIKKENHNCD